MISNGELIHLIYDEVPAYFYIGGHVEDDVALSAVRATHGDDYALGAVSHEYGRWACGINDGERIRYLAAHDQSGRGRFPMTAVEVMPSARSSKDFFEQ